MTRYRIWYVISERGVGQQYDYWYFDDLGKAEKIFKETNDWLDGGITPTPDIYVMALDFEKEIAHPGQSPFWLKFNP